MVKFREVDYMISTRVHILTYASAMMKCEIIIFAEIIILSNSLSKQQHLT